MSPSGFASVSMLLICGVLLGRGADARWLIGGGMLVVAAGSYWMSVMNLEISPWQVILPRVVTIAGLGMAFAPINVAAFMYTPRHMRAAAVGLFALLRNEGGSFGTSMAQTVQERRDQFHTWRMGEFLDPFNPTVSSYLERARTFYFQRTGDAPYRSGWHCKVWRTSGRSKRHRWPTSTSSSCSQSWGWGSHSWCC